MPRLSISERARVMALAADRARRRTLSKALYSPFLRWRYGPSVADDLLIVPQDLRTADPSFWYELELGQMGLAGSVATLDGKSPFAVRPPCKGWHQSLHGFSWLRHIAAAEEPEAREAARQLAVDWAQRHRGGSGLPWEPAVMGRRVISWIMHTDLLLADADRRTYDIITESLGFQLIRLSATWRDAPQGAPRLLALLAVVLADLSVAGHEPQLAVAERAFAEELERQIMADGGHISRNPAVLIELLLDLLPLSQCFSARERQAPPVLQRVISRSLAMLRHMRMGDGRLARFNGMGVASPAALATVLAYDDLTSEPTIKWPSPSGYARLSQGGTLVLLDAAPPPPLEFAGNASAGCLSFELSIGGKLVFANGGAPGPADADWRHVSRATASHNALVIGEKSSSKMVRHAMLEEMVGAAPIRFPDNVEARITEGNGAITFQGHHDGYVHRFGLLHHRRIALSEDGCRIEGVDRINGQQGPMRLKRDLPFAVHFHLHPDIDVRALPEGGGVTIAVPASGKTTGSASSDRDKAKTTERWTFRAEGAAISLENSIHFADSSGPRDAVQIVLRGATFGECEVSWSLTRS